jgi:hypothetical protein
MLIKDGFLPTEHEIAGLYQSEASARYGSSLSTQRAVYIKEASAGMVSRAGRSHTEANPCPRARFQNTPYAVSDSAVTMMICNHEKRYQMMTLEAALFSFFFRVQLTFGGNVSAERCSKARLLYASIGAIAFPARWKMFVVMR